ncbi:uncharacterized protein LOC117601841 [Osmia lignaria lignaria]|uniref:uncharacterized protein LOC117601841 n=1 Tax=Osmia lignaria lignaria TaxID=1437193 RepID=UPI00402B55CB
MDTSTYSHGNQSVQTVAQRKFYQWVLKWINGVHSNTESNGEEMRDIRHSAKPDVRILASFLQAIGFKLLSFEKHHDGYAQKKTENDVSSSEQGVLRVIIECDTSNMKAVLELEGITCRCPNSDHIKEASFWSISGTGPVGSTDNIMQKVEETGSNLIPPLSKDVARLLRDVSCKLFDTIAYEPDVNRNTDVSLNVSRSSNASCERQNASKKEVGVTRSHTQPEMRLNTNSLNSKRPFETHEKNINSEASQIRNESTGQENKPPLQRQRTWDIDAEIQNLDEEPRPSPPKLTSSPAMIAELSNSLGQISLHSDIDNSRNITEYIIGAKENLEKVLKMLLVKKPMILNDLSPNTDQDSASVKSAPANVSPTAVISPYKSTRMNTMDNIKLLPKQNNLTQEQFLKITRVPKARRSIEPILSRKNEQDSSKLAAGRRSSFYTPSSANSNISSLSKPEMKHKLLGIGKYNISKTSNAIESDISNRISLTTRVASPEPKIGTSPNVETSNGRASLIKPPTKIIKSIPVKIKPVQSSKINTGIVKKPRVSLPKD